MEGNCKECNTSIEVTTGRRPREFCTPACRNKFYYKQSRIGVEPKKKGRPKKESPFSDKVLSTTIGGGERYTNQKIIIPVSPTTENSFDGSKINTAIMDEAGQTEAVNPENIPILNQIAVYTEEMKGLQDVGLGKQRKKFLQNKIYELRKQLTTLP